MQRKGLGKYTPQTDTSSRGRDIGVVTGNQRRLVCNVNIFFKQGKLLNVSHAQLKLFKKHSSSQAIFGTVDKLSPKLA